MAMAGAWTTAGWLLGGGEDAGAVAWDVGDLNNKRSLHIYIKRMR